MSESPSPPDHSDMLAEIARDDEEAAQKYERWLDRDPFPDIPCALLNSADVYDYVRLTAMIAPFDKKLLKASSYEVSIGNRYIYWDGEGGNHDVFMKQDDEFVLHANSIGFVTTKEYFRLPHYIGARFNLRITNVHRGILLGTGPLVDPGFQGRLLVPLHNLTTNDYTFTSGEKFAWFEFTKVSPHTWSPTYDGIKRKYGLRGEYVPFPAPKITTSQDPRRYLARAWPQGAIRSSIPEVVVESKESARQARDDASSARTDASSAQTAAERARNTIYGIGGFAAVGVIVAVVTVMLSSWELVARLSEAMAELRSQQTRLELRVGDDLATLSSEIARTSEAVEHLTRSIGNVDAAPLHVQVDQLRTSVIELQAEVEAVRRDDPRVP